LVLDSINIESSAQRGVEKLTGKIWHVLVIRQSLDTIITLSCFVSGAYFKSTGQMSYNIISIAIAYLSNGILSLGYNAYSLHVNSKLVLAILKKTISVNASLTITNTHSNSVDNHKKLKATHEKFKIVTLLCVITYACGAVGTVALCAWTIATRESGVGPAYSSVIDAFLNAVFIVVSFLSGNLLFIQWW